MIVLDTNVVSELMHPSPAAAVLGWFSTELADELYTSAITEAEIFYGIELLPPGKRRSALLVGAETMFDQVFSGRVLAFDEEAARVFSRIAAGRRRRGRPMAELDAQIAAIACVHSAALATRNTADFEGCGCG